MEAVTAQFAIKRDSFAYNLLEKTFEAYQIKFYVSVLTDCMNATLGDFKRTGNRRPEEISSHLDVVKMMVKFLQYFQPEVFVIDSDSDGDLKAIIAAYEHFDPTDAYENIFQGLNDWIYQDPDDISTSIPHAYDTVIFYNHAFDIIVKASQYYAHLKSVYNESSK